MSASSSTVPTSTTRTAQATGRLYLVRAVIALLWAALLAVALFSTDTLSAHSDLPVLAIVLLILYPVIDVVASLIDARTQSDSGALRAQLVNAAISVVTTVAVIFAAIDGPAAILRVFGAWALLTGLIQLGLAVARLRQGQRGQWPMIVSGGLSSLIGLTFVMMASKTEISLGGLNGYAVGGAILYLVSAYRLYRTARLETSHA